MLENTKNALRTLILEFYESIRRDYDGVPPAIKQFFDGLTLAETHHDVLRSIVDLESFIITEINKELTKVTSKLTGNATVEAQKNKFNKVLLFDKFLSKVQLTMANEMKMGGGLAAINNYFDFAQLPLGNPEIHDEFLHNSYRMVQRIAENIAAKNANNPHEELAKGAVLLNLMKGIIYSLRKEDPTSSAFYKLLTRASEASDDGFQFYCEVGTAISAALWQAVGDQIPRDRQGEQPGHQIPTEALSYWETLQTYAQYKRLALPNPQLWIEASTSPSNYRNSSSTLLLNIPQKSIDNGNVDAEILHHTLFSGVILVNREGKLQYYPQQLIISHELCHMIHMAEGQEHYQSKLNEQLTPEQQRQWSNWEELWATIGNAAFSEFLLAQEMLIPPRFPYRQPIISLSLLEHHLAPHTLYEGATTAFQRAGIDAECQQMIPDSMIYYHFNTVVKLAKGENVMVKQRDEEMALMNLWGGQQSPSLINTMQGFFKLGS